MSINPTIKEELQMSINPAVKLILQPLRKLLDVADHVDSWHDEHKEDIASTKAELDKSTESADDRVEVSLLYDPFALTIFIEDAAEKIDGIGEAQIANQFRALLVEVDEVEGDENISMDALNKLLQRHCPVVDGSDEDWLPAELPSKCAKNLSMSLDTLQRRIKEKAVRVDVISQKSWRLHRVDAAKLGFSSQK